MNPERWTRIDELFQLALERDPPERAAFLAQACGNDVSLKLQIESLLAADGEAGTFLEGMLPPGATLAPGRRLGRYEIVALLGRRENVGPKSVPRVAVVTKESVEVRLFAQHHIMD